MIRRAARAAGAAAAALLVVWGAVYAAGSVYRRGDHMDAFARRHGRLASVEESLVRHEDGGDLLEVRLDNGAGLAVTGYVKVPAEGGAPYPAFLALGGLQTGKRTLDFIRGTRGVVLMALDYPYNGRKSHLGTGEFVRAVPRIRRAILDTVPAAMLAVDYLSARADVDTARIILVGGSVGALFAPAAAASDRRIAAAALLFGAADIEALMRANFQGPRWAAVPVSWAAATLVSPVEPVKYVGKISPRPVFMLNGDVDERIPRRFATLLHDAAREPKTIRWIDAGHVDIRSTEFHDMVSRELLEWLVGLGLVSPDCYPRADFQPRDS